MDSFILRRLGLALCLSGGLVGSACAATANDFVDNAATGSMAEIESSQLALQKSSSADVKAFAQQMVTDHTAVNQQLAALAKKLGIEVPDNASLTSKAKKMMLEVRKGDSFDTAYANNQVKAHEDTIKLFTKESESPAEHAELKAFATQTLPKLEQHLEMAKKIQAQHQ